ncbi:hypothetical protein C7H19_07115 [Aphanothece hegewaldii CCALA 016]|uniref:Glycosyltransferase RgtA/B/C/D-like domain-containing protein n=1 Tax=Aphanothece hegewaldii CCALA 016 TaxID=2107694 RepID=A0A2T1M0Q7_9CHRO|nr:glycosyltransferase family 39 protein [Aphanothece hegewaldii]PSF38232.1 hypothetical protein C7H19_07115 [Aphanothece hegewaldii CCALA 016]
MLDLKNNLFSMAIPQNSLDRRKQHQIFTQRQLYWFNFLLIILIIFGIFFRIINIENKVYWHDEVYTSIRAGGHLAEAIYKNAFNNRFVSIKELQKFQDFKPESTILDTIKSLIQEDPQHPPFYFILSRYTLYLFGNSLTYNRILAIFFSLLSIPLIYLFSFNLFQSKLIASLSAIILSLSPFDIIFAQINRQYSLLTLLTILSSWMLWRTLNKPTLLNWIFYTVACTLGLYTQPFFCLTIFSHFCFILIDSLILSKNKSYLIQFGLSIFVTMILYSPWIYVLITRFQKVLMLTNWVYFKQGFLFFVQLWLLNFTCLFTDFFVGINNPITYLYRLFFMAIIFLAFYTLYRQVNRKIFIFLLTLSFAPFLILLIPDLYSGSFRTVVTRYLIPCYPGIQIAVAYYLSKILNPSKIGKLILIFFLTNGIVFGTLITFAETSWAKVPSYYNAETAKKINAVSSPLVISDQGETWTNLGEIISLSYLVNKDTQFFLTSDPPNLEKLENGLKANSSPILVFQPSQKLKSSLENLNYRLENIYAPGNLYRLAKKS